MAIVHIDATLYSNGFGVDFERVALIDMIIEHGAKQIVRRAYSVEIARKMKVNIFHRNDLRVAAARCSALNPEYGPQRRLAKSDYRLFAHRIKCVCQAYGRSSLTLARRGRIDSRNEDEFSVFTGFVFQKRRIDFSLIFAVGFEIIFGNTDFFGNLGYRLHFIRLSDFYVGFHRQIPRFLL